MRKKERKIKAIKGSAVVAFVSAALFVGGCECGDAAVIPDESPSAREGASENGVDKPTMPERQDPTAHKSDCSRQELELLERDPPIIVPGNPSRFSAHHAALILDACQQTLPAPLRGALETVHTSDEGRESSPSMEEIEGFDALIERSCPTGMEVLSNTESMDWNSRLDAVYERCGLEALEFLSPEEFRRVRGPEHALVAAATYRWMVGDGVEVSLADRAARGVAGLGDEGPPDGMRSEILRNYPQFQLLSSTTELKLESYPIVVVGSEGIWEGGRRVVDIDDPEEIEPLRDYFRTLRDERLDDHRASLQLAMDADVDFQTVAPVFLAAAEADIVMLRLVVGKNDAIAESGSEIPMGEWKPPLAGINLTVPFVTPRKLEDAVGTDRHQVGLAVEIRADGIAVANSEGRVSARGECDAPKVSICLADPEATHRADRYDWPELYRIAAEQHRDRPDITTVLIRAEPEVSIVTLIRAMDTLRYRRQTDSGEPLYEHPDIDEEAFVNSTPLERDDRGIPVPVFMFPDPVLDFDQR